jgi:hypothetical protein
MSEPQITLNGLRLSVVRSAKISSSLTAPHADRGKLKKFWRPGRLTRYISPREGVGIVGTVLRSWTLRLAEPQLLVEGNLVTLKVC